MGKVTWKHLTADQKEALASLYTTGRNEEIPNAAKAVGLSSRPASVERDIRHYLYYKDLFNASLLNSFNLPETLPCYTDYFTLEADDAIIISDLEIPDQDSRMLKAALMVGMKRNIRTLIYNGDVVATDQDSLNTWVRQWRDGNEESFKSAIDKTRQVFEEYGKWFTNQVFVSGNHDNRVARRTGGEVYLEMFMRGTPAKFSRYTYMYLKTSRGWVYICHPMNYSIHAASKLGNDLWATHVSPEGTKCHVVLGHTHLAQTAWSPDGMQEIAATGCMRKRAQYKDTTANSFRQWQRGFLVVQNGYFYPMTEFGTDWQKELGTTEW